MSNNPLRRDEEALAVILREVEAGRIKLYRNVLRQPYVFCDHPDYPALHLHLNDKDFRGWLSHFVWKTEQFLLREREIDRILQELAGRSLSHPLAKIHDPALLQFIESEPVVAVLLEFMHTRKRHEANMDVLWKELKRFARGRRLLVRGKNRFPGGANVLSRKLALLAPILEQLGIFIDIKRSNGSKVILERRLDDSLSEPSGGPSAPKPSCKQDLSLTDDKAERIIRLHQRKHGQEGQNHE